MLLGAQRMSPGFTRRRVTQFSYHESSYLLPLPGPLLAVRGDVFTGRMPERFAGFAKGVGLTASGCFADPASEKVDCGVWVLLDERGEFFFDFASGHLEFGVLLFLVFLRGRFVS